MILSLNGTKNQSWLISSKRFRRNSAEIYQAIEPRLIRPAFSLKSIWSKSRAWGTDHKALSPLLPRRSASKTSSKPLNTSNTSEPNAKRKTNSTSLQPNNTVKTWVELDATARGLGKGRSWRNWKMSYKSRWLRWKAVKFRTWSKHSTKLARSTTG